MGESELLRHEAMYVMGQMRAQRTFPFLVARMNDEKEFPIVRHEAGEALANFHNIKEKCIPEMEKHYNSDVPVLKSTVRVGIEKLKTFSEESRLGKKFNGTIEPAEPFNKSELLEFLKNKGVEAAEQLQPDQLYKIVQEKILSSYDEVEEYPKYRMTYFLRDEATKEAIEVLVSMLEPENRENVSELLRHEVSFILGQINDGSDIITKILTRVSFDEEESAIVRHEAILAFYEIKKDEKLM